MDQQEYNETFETNKENSEKLKSAFKQVSDIRKFEIKLYWRRAAYFWALIAVAYAGYFSILGAENIPKGMFLSLVVACIGFVFTFAWHLANRGSKYWQENWENHLDLLEDKVTGPLYKTLLERPDYNNISEKYVTGPKAVSVSKINQWVSVFVLFSWVILIIFSAYSSLDNWAEHNSWILSLLIILIVGTITCCILMFKRGKTHKDKHSPSVVPRETEIE